MVKKVWAVLIALSVFATLGAEGANYVIIVPDAWVEAVQPLAEWKTRKGILTRIVPLSECGSSASQIKNYLVNAYNTWFPRPKYVLLVGEPGVIPFGSESGVSTDSYYANVEGDFKNELMVGRFSVSNAEQAAYMVYKTVKYESDPYLEDSLWFMKGTTIVREDGDADDSLYYWYDARMAHNFWRERGFVQIDSFSRFRGNNAADVLNSLNDGRSIVVFRGQSVGHWWSPFNVDVDQMQPTFKWPFVIGATCRTISSQGDYNMDREFTLAGDIEHPKGAIGYFGTTTVVSNGAWRRSYVTRGFLIAMYSMDRPVTLGEAAESGRIYLYDNTGNLTDYYGFQLIGDPELNLWTHTPITPELTYTQAIALGRTDTISVTVRYPDGTGVRSALVAIHTKNSNDIYQSGYTNSLGQVSFVVTPLTIDTIELVITGKNLMPTFRDIIVVSEGAYLTLLSDSVMEQDGNGDGVLNPGEMALLSINVKNIGSDTARNVTFTLIPDSSELVSMIDSTEVADSILPDETIQLDAAFSFVASNELRHSTSLKFRMIAVSENGDTWRIEVPSVPVITPEAELSAVFVNDSIYGNGDGMLSPTERFELILSLRNSAPTGVTNLTANVVSDGYSEIVPVQGECEFGEFLGDSVVTGSPLVFVVSNTAKAGDSANVKLELRGQGATYTYIDTVMVTLAIGAPTDPYGPESYGYWAYDNTDTASGRAPSFDWFEIAPPAGGPGEIVSEITNEDADTVTVALPFRFKFYGLNYDSIGLCSNGFMEFYRSSYRFGDNGPIPSPNPPRRMLAPFWDDLDPSLAGDIYQYYDEQNHRWILEFYQVAHYNHRNIKETFQVQLLDPRYYPTPTGDGIILFLYNHVSDASSATIGIEDHTNTRGIQYVYNNDYHISSAPIEDGRVIKFSTELPDYYPVPSLQMVDVSYADTISGNGNGLLEPGETFALTVTVVNSGGASLHDAMGSIETDDPDVVVLHGTAPFGEIDSLGGMAVNSEPFQIQVADTVTDTLIQLTLRVVSDTPSYEAQFPIELTNLLQGIAEGTPQLRFVAPRLRASIVRDFLNVEFALPRASAVTVSLFDVSGRRISFASPKMMDTGVHTLAIPVRQLRAGVYFIVVDVDGTRYPRKFAVVR